MDFKAIKLYFGVIKIPFLLQLVLIVINSLFVIKLQWNGARSFLFIEGALQIAIIIWVVILLHLKCESGLNSYTYRTLPIEENTVFQVKNFLISICILIGSFGIFLSLRGFTLCIHWIIELLFLKLEPLLIMDVYALILWIIIAMAVNVATFSQFGIKILTRNNIDQYRPVSLIISAIICVIISVLCNGAVVITLNITYHKISIKYFMICLALTLIFYVGINLLIKYVHLKNIGLSRIGNSSIALISLITILIAIPTFTTASAYKSEMKNVESLDWIMKPKVLSFLPDTTFNYNKDLGVYEIKNNTRFYGKDPLTDLTIGYVDKHGNKINDSSILKPFTSSKSDDALYGYKTVGGKKVISEMFVLAEPFHNEYAAVSKDGKTGQIIDKVGDVVYEAPLGYNVEYLYGSYFRVIDYENACKVYDIKTRKYIFESNEMEPFEKTSFGYAMNDLRDSKDYICDENFKLIDIIPAGYNYEGSSDNIICISRDGQKYFKYMDLNGNLLFEEKNDSVERMDISKFNNGIAAVSIAENEQEDATGNSHYAFIDQKGNLYLEDVFDYIESNDNGTYTVKYKGIYGIIKMHK